MKQLITTLAIMLSVFAFSTNTQAQYIEMTPYDIIDAPKNLNKAQLKKLFRANGISKVDAKK